LSETNFENSDNNSLKKMLLLEMCV